jgi:hypothetical protein
LAALLALEKAIGSDLLSGGTTLILIGVARVVLGVLLRRGFPLAKAMLMMTMLRQMRNVVEKNLLQSKSS